MKKASEILLKVFAIGIVVCLFAGGASILGYIIGIIIGGEAATNMSAFIFNTYLPWVIKFTSVFTGIGLVGMYFNKQKALTVKTEDIHNTGCK